MYLEKFAKNLRSILKEEGINQSTLALAIGVNKTAVSYWINA